MKLSDVEIEMLRQIRQSPHLLSWYQLDRHTVLKGLRPPEGIFGLLKKLESDRLIHSGPGKVEGNVCYELTDAGKAALEGGVS